MKGFTFIELILVVAIFLILGTMGTTLSARFFTQNAVINAQDQLINNFRKAQMNAMMGKGNSSWSVNYGGTANTITLYRGTPFAGHNTAFDETFTVSSSITITGVTDINFTKGTGLPNTTGTVTISGSSTSKTITINSQGVATR